MVISELNGIISLFVGLVIQYQKNQLQAIYAYNSGSEGLNLALSINAKIRVKRKWYMKYGASCGKKKNPPIAAIQRRTANQWNVRTRIGAEFPRRSSEIT